MSWVHEIYIITSRIDEKYSAATNRWNEDLYKIVEALNLSKDNVYFTNGDDKWKIVKDLEIELHFDDDQHECDLINKFTNCIAIQHQFWKLT